MKLRIAGVAIFVVVLLGAPAWAQQSEVDRAVQRFVGFQLLVDGLSRAEDFDEGRGDLAAFAFYRKNAAPSLGVGEGITYRVRNRIGGELNSGADLTVALLASSAGGSETWGYTYAGDRPTRYLEMVYNAVGIPVEVRSVDPYSSPEGERLRRLTRMGTEFDEIVEAEGLETTMQKIDQSYERWLGELTGELFTEAEPVAGEPVSVGAGTFNALHIVLRTDQGSIDFWYDENAPGAIVRYELVSNDEYVQLAGELVEVRGGYTERLQDAELVELVEESAPEEDLPDNIAAPRASPILLQTFYFVEASLEAGETDYFGVELPSGETVIIYPIALEGAVEVTGYGTGADFVAAQGESIESGGGLELRGPAGGIAYFTVAALDGPAAYYLVVEEAEE